MWHQNGKFEEKKSYECNSFNETILMGKRSAEFILRETGNVKLSFCTPLAPCPVCFHSVNACKWKMVQLQIDAFTDCITVNSGVKIWAVSYQLVNYLKVSADGFKVCQ